MTVSMSLKTRSINGTTLSRRSCARRCDIEIVQLRSVSYGVCAFDVHQDSLTDVANYARLPCETQYILAASLAETHWHATFLGVWGGL
eukprot:2382544-Pleurochrysis_carterae.AAC.1